MVQVNSKHLFEVRHEERIQLNHATLKIEVEILYSILFAMFLRLL